MNYKAYGVYGTTGDVGEAVRHLNARGINNIVVYMSRQPNETFAASLDEVNAELQIWSESWLKSLDEDQRQFMSLYRTKMERGDILVMIPADVVIDSSDAEINASDTGISPSNDYSQTDQGQASDKVHATDRYTDRVPEKKEFGVDQEQRYGVRSEDPERQTRK